MLKCDELEQYGRRNAIRITGLDKRAKESTDDIVLTLANDVLDSQLVIDEIRG